MRYFLVVFFSLIVAAYFLLDNATESAYRDVSRADAEDLKKIMSEIDGRKCTPKKIDDAYVFALSAEFPDFYFTTKSNNLVVNGHYFACRRAKDGYKLRFVPAEQAP